MSLIGNKVEHEKFGKGIISDFSKNIVTVTFPEGKKKFVYPDAFTNFLVLNDDKKQEAVIDVYNDKITERKEELHKKRQAEERIDRLLSIKTTAQSQAVFDINYQELDDILSSDTMFSGTYLSGKLKGEPKIPAKLKPNSACLLTSLKEGRPEKDREILGIFMVGENFYGSRCRDGNISIHPYYRLKTPDGASISYWKYASPETKMPRWGKTAFKYFSNTSAGEIISRYAELYKGTETEEKALAMKNYFLKLNHMH